jgi:hypothetical protein
MKLVLPVLFACLSALAQDLGNPSSLAMLKGSGGGGGSGFPTTGLIHYWALNEASGTRADSVGALDIAEVFSTGSSAGKNGNAALFTWNGSGFGYLSSSPSGVTIPSALSMSFWFKFSAVDANQIFYIGGATVGDEFPIQTTVDAFADTIMFTIGDGVVVSDAYVMDTSWHHVVVTASGTTGRIYLDGSLFNLDTMLTPDFSDWAYVLITAQNSGATSGSVALVDEFAVWNVELSAGDVTTLYNGGTGLFYAP